MAKKTKKSKPAKKATKSAKKAVAKKKPAKKVSSKKASPKKVKKAVKKVAGKKVVAKKATAKKSKPVKKAVVKKAVKAIKQKPAKVVSKKPVDKKKNSALAKQAKPVIKANKPEINNKNHSTGFVKKNEFVIDKRPISELKLNMEKPLINKLEVPKPKPHLSTDKRARYSDKELQEFKQIILKKLDEAKKDYELLKSTLSHKDDHGTDDTSPTFKLLEDGSDVLSKEETAQLAIRQEKFIQSLQNALVRIENKTYGICRVTGKLISKERLRSVPHATLAIEAKLDQVSAQ